MNGNRSSFTEVVDGVYVASAPIRVLGMNLASTMCLVRLRDGSLLAYSPVALTDERRAAVEALGTVSQIYAPNTYHHLFAGDWAAAFPAARLHAARGLREKRPDLRIDRVVAGTKDVDLDRDVDELAIDGFRLNETVLFHRASGTLVAADLAQNVGRPEGTWTRAYTKAMGFYDRVAQSRAIRVLAFSDRRAARRSVDAMLELPFGRIVVGHGEPVVESAKDALSDAYAWLRR